MGTEAAWAVAGAMYGADWARGGAGGGLCEDGSVGLGSGWGGGGGWDAG